jgi:hypothetical protein
LRTASLRKSVRYYPDETKDLSPTVSKEKAAIHTLQEVRVLSVTAKEFQLRLLVVPLLPHYSSLSGCFPYKRKREAYEINILSVHLCGFRINSETIFNFV